MARLQDSVILISGAGSTFAYALIERCVMEGARVAVLEEDAARTAQLQDDFGAEFLVVQGDLSSLATHQQALDAVLARHHRLDGFVANAWCADDGLSLAELPDDEQLRAGFDAIVGATVWRYICGARIVGAALRRQQGSMVLSLNGADGVLASAARHAGVGLVRQLAHELAPAVRVNGVCTVLPPRERRGSSGGIATERLRGQELDVLAPRYAPDPARQVEHYLALLLPAGVSAVTGTVRELDEAADIEGLISLA